MLSVGIKISRPPGGISELFNYLPISFLSQVKRSVIIGNKNGTLMLPPKLPNECCRYAGLLQVLLWISEVILKDHVVFFKQKIEMINRTEIINSM